MRIEDDLLAHLGVVLIVDVVADLTDGGGDRASLRRTFAVLRQALDAEVGVQHASLLVAALEAPCLLPAGVPMIRSPVSASFSPPVPSSFRNAVVLRRKARIVSATVGGSG